MSKDSLHLKSSPPSVGKQNSDLLMTQCLELEAAGTGQLQDCLGPSITRQQLCLSPI